MSLDGPTDVDGGTDLEVECILRSTPPDEAVPAFTTELDEHLRAPVILDVAETSDFSSQVVPLLEISEVLLLELLGFFLDVCETVEDSLSEGHYRHSEACCLESDETLLSDDLEVVDVGGVLSRLGENLESLGDELLISFPLLLGTVGETTMVVAFQVAIFGEAW